MTAQQKKWYEENKSFLRTWEKTRLFKARRNLRIFLKRNDDLLPPKEKKVINLILNQLDGELKSKLT